MKQFLLLLFIALAITSCKKKSNTNDKSYFSNSMSFDVDSVYTNGDSTHIVQCVANDSTLDIVCIESGTSEVGLTLGLNIAVGTYPFDSLYAPIMVYIDDPVNGAFLSINGSISILEHDITNHTIKGTFYGTVKQDDSGKLRVISNGKFYTHY